MGTAGGRPSRRRLRCRLRRSSTAAGRRSTTGPRSFCARWTGRSSLSARRWAATARSRSPAARRSAWSGWPSSDRAPTRTRSIAGAHARRRSPSWLPATDRRSPTRTRSWSTSRSRRRRCVTGSTSPVSRRPSAGRCSCASATRTSSSPSTRRARWPTARCDGRLEVFPSAGHFVAVDQPDRFNEVLLEFLSQWKT